MITLQRLKWSNCFSYGDDNELVLDDNTITQILGTNGVGKSSIPLIIEEALFNKNSKSIKKADIPNRYSSGGYSIQLAFTKDADTYQIDIARKSTVKVVLTKNGEDISSHTATNTYKTIQEILGVDFKTFSQLVYQNTNASLQFLTATDTNRKKFLIDLLHLDHYVELFEVFKDAAKESNLSITATESKIATIEKWLQDNKLIDTSLLEPKIVPSESEDDGKEAANLRVEIENISEKNKKISSNNQYREMLDKIDLASAQSIEINEKKNYDSKQSEVGLLRGHLATETTFQGKLEKLADKCPTCEQHIDEDFKTNLLEESKTRAIDIKQRTEALENEIEKIKSDNKLFESKVKTQKDWEDLYRSIDDNLPKSLLDKGELETRLEGLETRILEARQRIKEVITFNEDVAKKNTRIQVILEQTSGFQDQLDEALQVLNIEKELNSKLEILKKAFSTNGLLAYKIENLVKELEELANHYLSELSDGRFTLEFVVTNDRLNVEITDNGNVIDIVALSSGELARVNTATLIAIRKLMSSISKSKINILFLDEVISVLDEQGKEKLVEVLLEEDLNTYMVSHQWAHPLLAKVEVRKDGNVSRLENG